MRANSNYSDQWEDSDSGGQPCACGRRCAEADYASNPQSGPRAFCATDTHHIGAVIRGLPGMYVELRFKLAKNGQQQERVSGPNREAPVPLDLEVEAFMRHTVLVALSWEEQVRAAAANLSPIPDGAVRDGASLVRACRLLAGEDYDRTGYLGTLLALEPEDKNRPVPGDTELRQLEPGTLIRIDDAGDAWQKRALGGADAGLEFLKLNGRARGILGLTLQRRRVAVRCDGCESLTLVQREALGGGWEPVVRCTACPRTYIGAEFETVMGREFEATAKAGRAS